MVMTRELMSEEARSQYDKVASRQEILVPLNRVLTLFEKASDENEQVGAWKALVTFNVLGNIVTGVVFKVTKHNRDDAVFHVALVGANQENDRLILLGDTVRWAGDITKYDGKLGSALNLLATAAAAFYPRLVSYQF